jgi:hypothetical protein
MKNLPAIILFLLIGIVKISACDCKPRKSIIDEYKYSKSVIVGRILSKQQVIVTESSIAEYNASAKQMYGDWIIKYTLVINETIKGSFETDTVEVYTGLGVADCGFRFSIGEKYLVFGIDGRYNNTTFTIDNKSLWTNACMRTKLADDKEIEQLRLLAKK